MNSASFLAVVRWWLVVQGIGLAGLPLTTFLFRDLPDRGYAFGKSLGLLLIGYGAWLLAMLGLAPFGVPLLIGVAIAIGGIVPLVLFHSAPPASRPSPWSYLRRHWPTILFYETIFLLALFLMAWIRTYNPAPWGTERPMDYAFFNAIQRSITFPPHDPWLSGYSINYYYLGYLLMASVAMVSGLPPSVGFNLSLALVFALTALGIGGILTNLLALSRPIKNGFATRAKWVRGIVHGGVGGLGIVLVLIVGNQAGALQVLIGDHRVVALDGKQLMSALIQRAQGNTSITLPHPVHTLPNEFGSFDTIEPRDRVHEFNWWWPSRALWDEAIRDSQPVRIYNITEFPFFSFWLGDMHPHVMALPFGLLAMALVLATLARSSPPTFVRSRSDWLDVILTGIVLGSLYTINSWDLPTYILFYAGGLFLLLRNHSGTTADRLRLLWRPWGLRMVGIMAACWVLFAPFYLTFHSLVGADAPLTTIPVLAPLSRILAPVPARSALHSFLIIFGLFLIPLVGFTYACASPSRPDVLPSKKTDTAATQKIHGASVTTQRSQYGWLLWAVPVALVVGTIIGFPLFALAALSLLAVVRAMDSPNPAEQFVLLAIALGGAICFGTDLVHIRDVFGTRMNTIFKFYYQTWLIWGTVTAYACWWLVRWASARTVPVPVLVRRGTAAIIAIGFIPLLLGGLVYPAVNVWTMVRSGSPIGLLGYTPRENDAGGKEAIAWLRANAKPDSIILEMVGPGGGSYNPEGYSGVSASSGIPTVLGWYGHQSQWRSGDKTANAELATRLDAVETIYSTTDVARARDLLRHYRVTLIYVGSLERQRYTPASLAKFDLIATPVFQQGNVTIYQVD